MTLEQRVDDVVAAIKTAGYPVVVGPPYEYTQAPPVALVALPSIAETMGGSSECPVFATTLDVVCVATTAADPVGLVRMVDDVATALAPLGQVTGDAEDTVVNGVDSTAYRLTVDETPR